MRTFKLFLYTYFTCGIAYCLYALFKIVENKEAFLFLFEKNFGDFKNLKYFISMLIFINIVAWPLAVLQELKKKDLE